jgi:AraC-like DNA-binding protein
MTFLRLAPADDRRSREIEHLDYFCYYFEHHEENLPHTLLLAHDIASKPSYAFDFHHTDGGEAGMFLYTLSGQGMLDYAGQPYTLSPGHAFLVALPCDMRFYLPAGCPPWEALGVFSGGADFLGHVRYLMQQNGPVFALDADSPPICRIRSMLDILRTRDFADVFEGAAFLYQFILDIRRAMPFTHYDPDIEQAIEFMGSQFAREITIEEISAYIHLSRAYFTRRFRRQTGLTPIQYLTRLRLERACGLLRSTTHPVYTIGELCGFNDTSYFSLQFRKQYGITPTAFRTGALPTRLPFLNTKREHNLYT